MGAEAALCMIGLLQLRMASPPYPILHGRTVLEYLREGEI